MGYDNDENLGADFDDFMQHNTYMAAVKNFFFVIVAYLYRVMMIMGSQDSC